MPGQDHYWSQAASFYEREFVDPYRADVRQNPLHEILARLSRPGNKVVADLGCGLGPLLPFLSQHFQTVYAVDFAEGMLQRAREQVHDRTNVRFLQASFMDLRELPEPVDVAVAVNSLVMPSPEELDQALRESARCLKPRGTFLGILPAMDAVHYYTMLLVDRARAAGLPLTAARLNAAKHCEHEAYDFAFGQFRFRGLEQHFWQPFEVHYRFARAGLKLKQLKKVFLSWKQFASWKELQDQPPPWDWFFLARKFV
jgi:ubiquinone/menaquinone biosynthesis C-methylase UbiE